MYTDSNVLFVSLNPEIWLLMSECTIRRNNNLWCHNVRPGTIMSSLFPFNNSPLQSHVLVSAACGCHCLGSDKIREHTVGLRLPHMHLTLPRPTPHTSTSVLPVWKPSGYPVCGTVVHSNIWCQTPPCSSLTKDWNRVWFSCESVVWRRRRCGLMFSGPIDSAGEDW